MSTHDWRGICILPVLILCAGFIGAGMIVPAFACGVVAGYLVGAP